MSTKARRRRAVALGVALGIALGLTSLFRPAPRRAAEVTVPLGPLLSGLFPATASAQGAPINTGCSSAPTPADSLLGGLDGVLAIQINSLSLSGVTDADPPVPVTFNATDLPKDLNFAQSSGSVVGSFINGQAIQPGSYTQLSGVMNDRFRIRCAVQCNTDGNSANGTETWVTRGGSVNTSPDALGPVDADGADGSGVASAQAGGLAAVESSLDIAGGQGPQAFGPFTVSINVQAGGSVQSNLAFSATGACVLWDISPLLGNPAGTNYKIIPASQSASSAG